MIKVLKALFFFLHFIHTSLQYYTVISQNDIALSVDSGKAVALTLLDLSAAFDTIDHSLLYDCLHDWFGLDGTVLSWIKSYLSNKTKN